MFEVSGLSADFDGDLNIKVHLSEILCINELVELLVVLELRVAIQEESCVVLVGEPFSMQSLNQRIQLHFHALEAP